MNILVLEDNKEINNILTELLLKKGYTVFPSFNAFDALQDFKNNSIDCILTDLMLPIKSGEEFITEVRKTSNVHIIIISAKVSLEEKLEGLRIGADDYLIKPFSSEEVLIKLENYFNKKRSLDSVKSLNNGEVKFEVGKNKLVINSIDIELTSVEYLMVNLLFEEVNKVLTREQFLDYLYNNELYVYDRVVDTHIKNIRQKVKKVYDKTLIKTVYGLGYMLVGDLDG
ncbi:response regulator transcription factor [Mycoplasmatota bacterium]|nr:response regulator transcription factor [Mycoplasmatota bacterium]